ncbi:MAG TPA: 5'/3'-nucleotidase SurE [Thermotogota bacterium]|nr:5'/3'-nucleotidase SurE [Thermotogota bacterium]HPJ88381.1 5'/3'-nucleotidase SurE [Thermotogota bacterium]HPR95451.1 5'/3'-nucleotidase SurE [Thermotogota bacterium]
MKILITNDDGIMAEGIFCLKRYLTEAGHEVIVSAPATEQSATGHAITLRKPLWAEKTDREGEFFGYGVTGTPADSVKIGILEFAKRDIDIVISGINKGANLGTDIPYSGTVSGALEGAIMGYPAIAISSLNPRDSHFETAARFLTEFLETFDIKSIKPFGALNINVPSIPYHELKGYKLTRQSARRFDDYFEKRKDPYGNDYFWLMGTIKDEELPEDSDWAAIRENYVSITPLTVFMCDCDWFNEIKNYRKDD